MWANENHVRHDEHAGCRKNYSTVDQIFNLQCFVQKYLSKKKGQCYAIFVDLSKAFDAIPHLLGGGPRVVVSTAAFYARVRGSVPGLGGLKETKLFLSHPRVKVSIAGSLRDREVACSALDRQGSNFESCVWRTVSSQSSHHPQEVLLAQFSLYVHKGGLMSDSFHFYHIHYYDSNLSILVSMAE